MNDRIYDTGRDLWLPLLVVVAGCALSLLGHRQLIEDRNAQLIDGTQESIDTTTLAIRERVGAQVSALRGLARLWTQFGMGPVEEWRADVDLLIDSRSGLSAVAWVDLDAPDERVAVGDQRALSDVEIDAEAARESYPNPRIIGPERSDRGDARYRILLPVEADGSNAGMLVAHVKLAELLQPVLEARAPGHAVRIRWRDELIFDRGVPAASDTVAWWHAEREIELPFGVQWRMTHEPTAALASRRLNRTPHYLLAAAVLVSSLLGLLLHKWRQESRQARFLEAVNRTLEERGEGLEKIQAELERRVSKRTAQLEEAIEELEAFNRSVSHDLRSPLGAVLNFAAILEEDYRDRPLDAEGLSILSRIRASADRAVDLLEGLLQISRAGREAFDFEEVDLTELAREIFSEVSAASEDADVAFELAELPRVEGDRELLGAVFANLFSNAIKYARPGVPLELTVTGTRSDTGCIIEVQDNGQGFEMRYASKLFGLFERLHHDEEIEGTGLGLALVARIVKRHGGQVWAHGEPGKGARFTFVLPDPSVPDRNDRHPQERPQGGES